MTGSSCHHFWPELQVASCDRGSCAFSTRYFIVWRRIIVLTCVYRTRRVPFALLHSSPLNLVLDYTRMSNSCGTHVVAYANFDLSAVANNLVHFVCCVRGRDPIVYLSKALVKLRRRSPRSGSPSISIGSQLFH